LVGGIRTPLADALVGASVVEVSAELVEKLLQVVMTADQDVVEAFLRKVDQRWPGGGTLLKRLR
jgi:hypothetical protein